MPHIIVEYADDVFNQQGAELFTELLFVAVEETGLFEPQNIKVRCHPVSVYKTAFNDKGFVHTQCRLHRGRSVDQKKTLTEAVINVFKEMELSGSVVTAEVVDMDTESYNKFTC